MPQLTQGLIIAVLIGLLLAIVVGYYLRQGQVNELSDALHQSQRRQEELSQEHEQRLRDATAQLQKDYETQLAESMERYQAQYEEQLSQLEAEYRARQSMAEGDAAANADSSAEQRIRKQYEARLKEAATKIQQAYEQHLQEKLVEARSQAQQDYDQRLAEAIAHYQDETQLRLAQASDSAPPAALGVAPAMMGSVASTDLAEVEARLQGEYDQRLVERLAEYQDDMNQRLAQTEQDYQARLQMAQSTPAVVEPSAEELELNLRRELETSLREEYEQKLAEKIEHYQDELTQRTQDLEQSYEARLQLLQASTAVDPASVTDMGEFDLDTAIAAANAATLDPSLGTDLELEDADTLSTEPAALSLADAAGDFAALSAGNREDSDRESEGDEFGLDPNFDTESLDATGLETDLDFEQSLSSEPATPSSDMGFDSILDDELENAQTDEFGLASDFDNQDLDLDALLNASESNDASEDLLDGLDDISSLS